MCRWRSSAGRPCVPLGRDLLCVHFETLVLFSLTGATLYQFVGIHVSHFPVTVVRWARRPVRGGSLCLGRAQGQGHCHPQPGPRHSHVRVRGTCARGG